MVLRRIIGAVILGFIYYKNIGCSTGACLITSSKYISTIYGALIGLLYRMYLSCLVKNI